MIDFRYQVNFLIILPKWIVEGNAIDNVFMSFKSEFLLSSFSVPNLASSIVGSSNESDVFFENKFMLVIFSSNEFCCFTYHHSYWKRSLWEEGRVLWVFYTVRSVGFSWIRFSLSALPQQKFKNTLLKFNFLDNLLMISALICGFLLGVIIGSSITISFTS